MKATRSIAVVYQNAGARDKAVIFCDCMIKRFWAQCEFEVRWWPFEALDQPRSAKEAMEKAAVADLIIFSCERECKMPAHVGAWIESWVSQRGDREGTLAHLCDSEQGATEKDVYLRAVAHRAGMDYITEVPQDLAHCIPDSLESYSERASQVTGVLEGILKYHLAPPRL
jgi:hypothetical protein